MGMRLANGNWSDALADTPENQAHYGAGSGYQGSAGYGSTQYGVGGGSPQSAGGGPQSGGSTQSGAGAGDTSALASVKAAIANNDKQLTQLMQAISATNEQDFAEKVREYNEGHSLALQQFGLSQEKQTFDEGLQAAGLTGTYNGQQTQAAQQQQFSQTLQRAAQSGMMADGTPTEEAKEFQQSEAEKQRQFDVSTGTDLTKLGASLSGPADYFKFNNAMDNGQSILDSLKGGTARPAFSAPPAGSIQPLTLSGIMGRLGIGGGQGATSATVQNAIPDANGASSSGGKAMGLTLPNGMGSIPLPHQINPAVWDSWGPTGQAFIKSAAAAAGYDPQEFENQVNATRPGTMAAAPQGASSFAGAGGGGASAY